MCVCAAEHSESDVARTEGIALKTRKFSPLPDRSAHPRAAHHVFRLPALRGCIFEPAKEVAMRTKLTFLVLLVGCATAPGRGAREFAVEVSGEGPPIVFIPGLASSGEVWSGVVKRLERRHRCHVLTLAGFAGQPPVEAPFLPRVRDALARYIVQHRLERPIVVGHSLGGVVALDLAAQRPELVGPLVIVDALPFLPAASDPTATPSSARPQGQAMRKLILQSTSDQFRAYEIQVLRGMIRDEDQVERALEWVMASDPRTIGEAVVELFSNDLRPSLPRVASPTLVIATWIGMGGFLSREQVERSFRQQYAGLPQAQLVMADKAKHFVMLDDPEFLLDNVERFISSQTASRLADKRSP
jgi:N-formylmaleamate deformylase